MVWIITGVGLVVVLFIISFVRSVAQHQVFFDASGGAWKPRFLVVMFQKEVESEHRPDQPGDAGNSVASTHAERYVSAIAMGLAAQSYGIQFEDVAYFTKALGCDWARAYELRGISKRRQEVLFAHASLLVESLRKDGTKAYAGVVPEWDKKPLGVANYQQLLVNRSAVPGSAEEEEMEICEIIGIPLAHANIERLVGLHTGLSQLLPRKVSPIELLEGSNWFVQGVNPPK